MPLHHLRVELWVTAPAGGKAHINRKAEGKGQARPARSGSAEVLKQVSWEMFVVQRHLQKHCDVQCGFWLKLKHHENLGFELLVASMFVCAKDYISKTLCFTVAFETYSNNNLVFEFCVCFNLFRPGLQRFRGNTNRKKL